MSVAKVIETEVWKPHPKKRGWVTRTRSKTVQEVYDEVVKFLEEEGLYDIFDSFVISDSLNPKDDFPDWSQIACYTIPGSNEGYFIFVDVKKKCSHPDEKITFYKGRVTHGNMDHVLKVSNLLTKAFYGRP